MHSMLRQQQYSWMGNDKSNKYHQPWVLIVIDCAIDRALQV